MSEFVSSWQPKILSVLRIMSALLFMEHGLMKAFHFPIPQPGVPDPLPMLLVCAASIEIIGGALLTAGLFSKMAAFICSGQMAIGYFISHATKGFWPGANGGDAAILFCFIFLYIAVAGPGAWSLDAIRARRSAR